MTGAIPKYGDHFRLQHTRYSTDRSGSIYVSKEDPNWYIQSDKTSKKWTIYHHSMVTGKVWPSLTVAMEKVVKVLDILNDWQ